MIYRYTLRTTDADDVGTGRHVDERWLRIGDEIEVDGKRWRIVDKLHVPEQPLVDRLSDEPYVDAMLMVEPA